MTLVLVTGAGGAEICTGWPVAAGCVPASRGTLSRAYPRGSAHPLRSKASPVLSPHIRPIAPADHARVGAILADAYGAFATRAASYHAYARTPAMWVDDASEVFVAVADGRAESDAVNDTVVGVVVLALEGSPLHEQVEPPTNDAGFRLLAVDPSVRGHGVARQLVQACIARADQAGARRIGIYTMDFMSTAQRLYDRMGFDRRPDLDVEFPSGIGFAYTLDLVTDAANHYPPSGPAADPPPWYRDVLINTRDSTPAPFICGP